MKLVRVNALRGFRALAVVGDRLVLSRGHSLFVAEVPEGRPRSICTLPQRPWQRAAAGARLLRRLLRHNVHCAISLGGSSILVSSRVGIHRVDGETGEFALERAPSEGFRPLTFSRIAGLAGFRDGIYFGEYDGRISHSAIRVLRRDGPSEWQVMHTFQPAEVDHIHTLVPDPHRRCVWILTGDYENAPGIWMARDDFQTVVPVLRGRQEHRTCRVFPFERGLLYATDSHLEPNSLRWLEERDGHWVTTAIRPLVGSCVYAARVGDDYFFSSAVEPGRPSGRFLLDLIDFGRGPGILEPVCEIVGGSPNRGFDSLARWQADALPKRLFQFSAIAFPTDSESLEHLVTYGMGVRGHDDVTEIHRIER